MQNVNHMWSDVLRLAGCGERAVLSSQTAIQWQLLLCLFVEHKSELKVFLKSIERKKKRAGRTGAFIVARSIYTRPSLENNVFRKGDVSFSGVRL